MKERVLLYPIEDNQETGDEEIFRKLGEAQQILEKFLETGTDPDLHTRTGYSYQEPRFQTHAEFQMKMRADYAKEQTERKKKEMAALMIALGLGTDFDIIILSSIKKEQSTAFPEIFQCETHRTLRY